MEEDTLRFRTEERQNALFFKLPDAYSDYAEEWCSYPHWTLEEAANLLTGCVPHRQMFLRGKVHAALDDEVLETENLIRAALHGELEVVKRAKYFGKTYLNSEALLTWADRCGLEIPEELAEAADKRQARFGTRQYSTPCMQAARWVIENFWEKADLREPPSAGAIIHALLQEFPDLSGEECDWVEKVTRHPLSRPNH